ncbi:hypothetical protein N7474_000910 [Penicillium riverlandense]|uniref:uncharacterized protein n=1 Tax=Penicillium riverlandense TaxID=1903569 RepID=UPI002549761D|nr:uncharacterized protein N7474_000910 [Penicillium riverlandense]KAJ5832599.1 hypothetical protein N7474_000910 [Penicillium riverlandense]
MIWNCLLVLSVLGSLPFSSAVPADLVPRQTTGTTVEPTRSHPTSQAHTPFTGTPTTTGVLTASSVGTGISGGGPAPGATNYPSDGKLHSVQPAGYVPAGGVGTNGSEPVYNAKSDFDYQSLALGLYQEWIELDLFQDGLNRFSDSDFSAAGLTSDDRDLIAFMAQQEAGHATMLSNILGAEAPQQCSYVYPYTNVLEFVDFCQKLTRFGESGVYGFIAHLDSREAATLLTQSITTEARQQMIFRQFEGLFPMPVWFEVGVPQSWAWTLLAPFISSCPANQTRLVWQNFPALSILNQPNPFTGSAGTSSNVSTNGTSGRNQTTGPGVNSLQIPISAQGMSNSSCGALASSSQFSSLSFPGRQVGLKWDAPGKPVGPNNSYVTSTQAGSPKYVVWVSQLNVTYTPLRVVGNGTLGYTSQPDLQTYQGDPAINGTMFIAITDDDPFLTPFNLSLINPHVVAGPALYQAG